ncbi:MAG: hypothetical protein FWH40_01285 [Coriobacteriia bacterium]|nr:hypothetical protein [Coriobacteriia bacterium]
MNDYQLTFEEANSINTESNLGLEYLALSTRDYSGQNKYNPDQPEIVFSEDGNVIGYYFKYPFDSDDVRLRQIRINGGDYDLFGIKVADDIAKASPIMTGRGYNLADTPYYYEGTASVAYSKYHVYIAFETEPGSTAISSILVSLVDPNEPVIMS